MEVPVNELALFAGAGGGLLAAELLGWTTVCAVERDAYAAQVLAQRQNDGVLQPFPIWSDVSSFDGRPWRGIVDVVSGGFPCQDISIAGKGAGIDGERSGLWAQMARIIGEVQPRFVLVENSPVLTARGLGRVLGDLATLRYDAEWGVVSAADVKAPHKRERLWIVAYANCARESQQAWRESEIGMGPIQCGEAVANTSGIGHGLSIGSVRPGRHAIESGVKLWPTPTAMTRTGGAALCKWGGSRSREKLRTMVTSEELNGPLNPQWVEWLMGWPIGWTDLQPLAMDKYREWLQQHGGYSAEKAA